MQKQLGTQVRALLPTGSRGWVGASGAMGSKVGLHVSGAARAFPPRPLPQPERKHGCDLLGSRPALGGQGVGDANRKINGLSFRCFRTEDGGGADLWAKGVVQPVCCGPWGCHWGVPRSLSGLCPPQSPQDGAGLPTRETPEGRPEYFCFLGAAPWDPHGH